MEINNEKKVREKALQDNKTTDENESNKDRVRKGLKALGLEGHKSKEDNEMEKRKNIMANLKGLVKWNIWFKQYK